MVRKGYVIPFRERPVLCQDPLFFQQHVSQQLEKEVANLLLKGAVKETKPECAGFYSGILLVPKKNRKLRLIIDLSALNHFVDCQSFKMEMQRKVRNAICLNDSAFSLVGEAGAEEVRDLVENIISEGCIPADWQESFIVNLYKGKGDALNRGNYRGLKLIEQVMKVLERVVEGLIRQRVEIDEMQCGFMSGRGTTDAIFIVRQLQEKHLAANKPLYMAFVDLEKAFDHVPRDVIWWAMRKLGIDEWLVRLFQSMYKDVRSRVRVGDGYSEEFGVGVGVHQGSVLSPLLFIIVLEALSREFRTGCPWELLYADDLMISAGSMEELLVKVKTWKTEMEKKGLRVNMGKTKIMESGINLDVLKKSGKNPCGACLTGVGRTNAIQCDGCKCWVHKKCSGIKGRLLRESEFTCARCLGTARAIDGRHSLEVEVGNQKLEVVPEFCYLGDMLSAGGGCELAASWLQSHAANVHGASSGNCFPFSPTAKCPF